MNEIEVEFDKWKDTNLLIADGEVLAWASNFKGQRVPVTITIGDFEDCFKAAWNIQEKKINKHEEKFI